MPPDQYEVLMGIRIILFLGALFVFIVLFVDNMGSPPPSTTYMRRRWDPRVEDEECKLHARKLTECKRLGYHKDGTDDEPE